MRFAALALVLGIVSLWLEGVPAAAHHNPPVWGPYCPPPPPPPPLAPLAPPFPLPPALFPLPPLAPSFPLPPLPPPPCCTYWPGH
jgi:hypothetical protein